VDIGRVRLEEGNLAGATQVLDKALKLSPNPARAHYFYSRVLLAWAPCLLMSTTMASPICW
jgi:cytochrome c-type biogenesis protein CcmH/NrfG